MPSTDAAREIHVTFCLHDARSRNDEVWGPIHFAYPTYEYKSLASPTTKFQNLSFLGKL